MFFIILYRYLRGYVKFSAHGGSAERFMNLCAHRGVALWGSRRIEGQYVGYTTVQGYRQIHELAQKSGVYTKIEQKTGVPFKLHDYRKRIGIAIGAALFVLLLAVSQQFIWVVEVDAGEAVNREQLVSALEELGVRPGARKSAIDPEEIRLQMTIRVKDLSWAMLNIHGTTASFVYRERTPPPQKIDTGIPANIVASRDGFLTSLEVTEGWVVRQKGETVQAGEIIVSGVHEDRWGLTHFVRANAQIMAYVSERLEVQVPLKRKENFLTGESRKRNYLQLFGAEIPLFVYTPVKGQYTIENNVQNPALLGLELPFSISSDTYVFYEEKQVELSEEQAMRIAKQQLAQLEKDKWDGKVASSEYFASVENGILKLTGDYMVEMDIAVQQDIVVLDDRDKEERELRDGGY